MDAFLENNRKDNKLSPLTAFRLILGTGTIFMAVFIGTGISPLGACLAVTAVLLVLARNIIPDTLAVDGLNPRNWKGGTFRRKKLSNDLLSSGLIGILIVFSKRYITDVIAAGLPASAFVNIILDVGILSAIGGMSVYISRTARRFPQYAAKRIFFKSFKMSVYSYAIFTVLYLSGISTRIIPSPVAFFFLRGALDAYLTAKIEYPVLKTVWKNRKIRMGHVLLSQEIHSVLSSHKGKDGIYDTHYLYESGVIRKTPLVPMKELSELTGKTVYLKDESSQRTGSFRIRGIAAEVEKIMEDRITSMLEKKPLARRPFFLVGCMDEKQALAVAEAVLTLSAKYQAIYPWRIKRGIRKIRPLIFTPRGKVTTARGKIIKEPYSGKKEVSDHTNWRIAAWTMYSFTKRLKERAISLARGHWNSFEDIGGYCNLTTMAGNATAGMEIDKQLLELGIDESKKVTVIVPVGRGEPIGAAYGLKMERENVKIVIVQTRPRSSFIRSLITGRRERNEEISLPTVFIGKKGKVFEEGMEVLRPDRIALSVAKAVVDEGVIVDSEKSLNRAAVIMQQDLDETDSQKEVAVGGTAAATGEALLAYHDSPIVESIKNSDVVVLFAPEASRDPDIVKHIQGSIQKSKKKEDQAEQTTNLFGLSFMGPLAISFGLDGVPVYADLIWAAIAVGAVFLGVYIIKKLRSITMPKDAAVRLRESYSGVRGNFGDDESISDDSRAICFSYAYAYAEYMIKRWRAAGKNELVFVVARDPRPTGKAIRDIQVAGFLDAAEREGVTLKILDLGVSTTPLAESTVRAFNADGGVMITASHNPLEDNGFKYLTGKTEPDGDRINARGGILSPEKMHRVIEDARANAFMFALPSDEEVKKVLKKKRSQIKEMEFLYSRDMSAFTAYLENAMKTFGLKEETLWKTRDNNASIHVAVDPNGGGASYITSSFLGHFKHAHHLDEIKEINGIRGSPSHQIEPYDEALNDLKHAIRSSHALFGVALDYDADRGTIVLGDGEGRTRHIRSQDVTALNTLLMLSWTKTHHYAYPEAYGKKWAVVVSDVVSLRIKDVAKEFGVEVFEVETGEVNVVSKMHELEEEGYFVPMGMEASGTIYRGSEVRDGSLTALLYMLTLGEINNSPKMRGLLGLREDRADYTLIDILSTLPKQYTFQRKLESDGVTLRPGTLQERLEDLFEEKLLYSSEGEGFKVEGLGDTEFISYEFLNYEGTRVRKGKGARKTRDGGFKILLTDIGGDKHFMQFRESRTESGIIRVCTDSPDSSLGVTLNNLVESLYDEAISKGREKRHPFKEIVVTPDDEEKFGEEAAKRVSAKIVELQGKGQAAINMVLATGNTQVAFLKALAADERIDWDRIHIFHLDEYRVIDEDGSSYALPREHESSFAYYINKNLISHVEKRLGRALKKENIHFISDYVNDGRGIEKYMQDLRDLGGCDIEMLGIGPDGHLAFNEKGDDFSFGSIMREVGLEDSTIKANIADYPGIAENPYAYTMGMRDIAEAKNIFFLARGGGKADIVEKALLGPVTEDVPGSMLRKISKKTTVIIEKATAGEKVKSTKSIRVQRLVIASAATGVLLSFPAGRAAVTGLFVFLRWVILAPIIAGALISIADEILITPLRNLFMTLGLARHLEDFEPSDEKVLIVYYSGSGGTRILAEEMQKRLKKRFKQVDITDAEYGVPHNMAEYNIPIFFFPCFYLKPPKPMMDFVDAMERFDTPRQGYAFVTMAAFTMNTMRIFVNKLLEKNIYTGDFAHFRAPATDCSIILFPSNWIKFIHKYMVPHSLVYGYEQGIRAKMDRLAEKIAKDGGKKKLKLKIPPLKWYTPIMAPIQKYVFDGTTAENFPLYKDKTKCKGLKECGMCINGCVQKAWTSDKDKKYGEFHPDRCRYCLRCIHHCPHNTILASGKEEFISDNPKLSPDLHQFLRNVIFGDEEDTSPASYVKMDILIKGYITFIAAALIAVIPLWMLPIAAVYGTIAVIFFKAIEKLASKIDPVGEEVPYEGMAPGEKITATLSEKELEIVRSLIEIFKRGREDIFKNIKDLEKESSRTSSKPSKLSRLMMRYRWKKLERSAISLNKTVNKYLAGKKSDILDTIRITLRVEPGPALSTMGIEDFNKDSYTRLVDMGNAVSKISMTAALQDDDFVPTMTAELLPGSPLHDVLENIPSFLKEIESSGEIRLIRLDDALTEHLHSPFLMDTQDAVTDAESAPEGGFIHQGEKSIKKMIEQLDEIRKTDITETYKERTRKLLGYSLSLEYYTPEERADLSIASQKMKDYRIYGFNSIVEDVDDFIFDWNSTKYDRLFLAKDLLEDLEKRGPPLSIFLMNLLGKMKSLLRGTPFFPRRSLADEYLLHSVMCPVLGHEKAILRAQLIFPENYPNKRKLERQNSSTPYKGELGRILRKTINDRVEKIRPSKPTGPKGKEFPRRIRGAALNALLFVMGVAGTMWGITSLFIMKSKFAVPVTVVGVLLVGFSLRADIIPFVRKLPSTIRDLPGKIKEKRAQEQRSYEKLLKELKALPADKFRTIEALESRLERIIPEKYLGNRKVSAMADEIRLDVKLLIDAKERERQEKIEEKNLQSRKIRELKTALSKLDLSEFKDTESLSRTVDGLVPEEIAELARVKDEVNTFKKKARQVIEERLRQETRTENLLSLSEKELERLKSGNFRSLEDFAKEAYEKIHPEVRDHPRIEKLIAEALEEVKVRLSKENTLSQRIIVMGASAWGYRALRAIIGQLPNEHPPIVVSEHYYPEKESMTYFEEFMNISPKNIILCRMKEGDAPRVYPLEKSMILIAKRVSIELDETGSPVAVVYPDVDSIPEEQKARNSTNVDELFASAAKHFGSDVTCAVLSGFSFDGTDGAEKVYEAGGRILVQKIEKGEDNLYSPFMPRAVVEREIPCEEVPINELGSTLMTEAPASLREEEPSESVNSEIRIKAENASIASTETLSDRKLEKLKTLTKRKDIKHMKSLDDVLKVIDEDPLDTVYLVDELPNDKTEKSFREYFLEKYEVGYYTVLIDYETYFIVVKTDYDKEKKEPSGSLGSVSIDTVKMLKEYPVPFFIHTHDNYEGILPSVSDLYLASPIPDTSPLNTGRFYLAHPVIGLVSYWYDEDKDDFLSSPMLQHEGSVNIKYTIDGELKIERGLAPGLVPRILLGKIEDGCTYFKVDFENGFLVEWHKGFGFSDIISESYYADKILDSAENKKIGTPEEDFTSSVDALLDSLKNDYEVRGRELDQAAHANKKEGESLILYADDLLENAAVIDLESTIRKITSSHGILAGGKIILFAREEANAIILEKMITEASSDVEVITITEEELKEDRNLNGKETDEVKALVKVAKARSERGVLALIKAPPKDTKKDPVEDLVDLSDELKVPVILLGLEEALYSLASALEQAIKIKGQKGSHGWVVSLLPIRTITKDIEAAYLEYQRSLQAYIAA
ncbi:pyridoxal-phosphate dependent enzyme [Candidatus Omnitrophota bacterium]